MKLYLTDEEKRLLKMVGKLTIKRELYLPAAKGSIMYGTGVMTLFDKIDYRWVYGNTGAYKNDMMNIGRRRDDYPDNSRNTWNGAYWWSNESNENPYPIQTVMQNGIKNIIQFKIIKEPIIKELKPHTIHPESTKKIVLEITIKLID